MLMLDKLVRGGLVDQCVVQLADDGKEVCGLIGLAYSYSVFVGSLCVL